MGWDIYHKGTHQYSRPILSPEARICRDSHIVFNKACTDWLNRHKAEALCLLWNAETATMAVKICSKDDRNGYGFDNRGNQASMWVRSFLRFIGSPQIGKYPASLNDKDLMIEVRLKHSI